MRPPPDTCGSCHFGQFHDQMLSGVCTKFDSVRVADQTCEKFARPQKSVSIPKGWTKPKPLKKPKKRQSRSKKVGS